MSRSFFRVVADFAVLVSLGIFFASCGEATNVKTASAALSTCDVAVAPVDADEETTRLSELLDKYSITPVGLPEAFIDSNGGRTIVQNLDAKSLDGSTAALAVTVSCNANCNIAIGCQPQGCEPSGKTCTSLTCKQTGNHGCASPVCTRTLTSTTTAAQ